MKTLIRNCCVTRDLKAIQTSFPLVLKHLKKKKKRFLNWLFIKSSFKVFSSPMYAPFFLIMSLAAGRSWYHTTYTSFSVGCCLEKLFPSCGHDESPLTYTESNFFRWIIPLLTEKDSGFFHSTRLVCFQVYQCIQYIRTHIYKPNQDFFGR